MSFLRSTLPIFPRRPLPKLQTTTSQIVSLFLLSALAGAAGEYVGAPAPYLIVAILIGAGFAMLLHQPARMPKPLHTASQAGVGAMMGSELKPDAMASVSGFLGPLLTVTVLTIVLSVLISLGLNRVCTISRRSATLGLAPGGSSAIVSAADEMGADSHAVAFAQYVRVALIALSAPLVVQGMNAHPAAAAHHVETTIGPMTPLGVLVLGAVTVGGVVLARRVHLPAAALLGPMIAGAVVTVLGVPTEFAPSGLLADAAFALVGLEVGLRFTRQSLVRVRRLALPLTAAVMTTCVACGAVAWAFAQAIGIPFRDAYLATTPGGINAVLSTAAATHANLPLISSVQSLRLFVVALVTPPAIKAGDALLTRRRAALQTA